MISIIDKRHNNLLYSRCKVDSGDGPYQRNERDKLVIWWSVPLAWATKEGDCFSKDATVEAYGTLYNGQHENGCEMDWVAVCVP